MYVQIVDDYGDAVEVELQSKTFSTGSRGFSAQGKQVLNKVRYTVNIILVEIGSKPKG